MEILNRKRVRVALVAFIGLCLVLIGLCVYKSSQNPYGAQLEVANLTKYISGKPIDKAVLNYIKHDLYTIVNLNTRPLVKNNSINDVLVRDKSFSQTYDTKSHVYTVHFIVDIKSLRQSYRVSYQWTTDDTRYGPNKAEYGTQVACLPVKELMYGDFHCKDARIIENGTKNYDPILKLLPYYVPAKFKITHYQKSVNYVDLYVDAYPKATEVSVSQQDLNEYTKDIKAWLRQQNLDPDHYAINYNY
jgi:hypothetical protein